MILTWCVEIEITTSQLLRIFLPSSITNELPHFLCFSAIFLVEQTSSVLLTSVSLADIFLQSLKTHSLDTLGGLTYNEFWEALCRCAVVAYSDKDVSNLDKLRGLFLYMSHKVDQSVPVSHLNI